MVSYMWYVSSVFFIIKQLLDNAIKKIVFVLWTYMPDVTQIETRILLIMLDIEKLNFTVRLLHRSNRLLYFLNLEKK